MNPPPRPPTSSGGNPGSSDPRRRARDDFDQVEDADLDDFDTFEDTPPSSASRRAAAPEVDPDEAFFEDRPDESRADDSASRPGAASGRSGGTRSTGEASPTKGFFESLEAGLRSAGQTAERYTRIGVARAEMEKLRYDLKAAHAILGELAMRCWTDAPDLGLTSKDPAVDDAVKKVKELRLKIREKQAKIAELKREN